jgi:small subunit ribosomal protein S3Ae
MTAGKNPRNFKKKGQKKKLAHPFMRKEWYNVLAPGFDKKCITLTPCNKTAGQKIAADSLKGRVFTTSLADCNYQSENQAWRQLKFQIDEVKGFDCYTNFYGMDISRDKACSMIKKWHSLIEAFVQAKTADGFIVRLFCIAFTKRTKRQVKATCYAKASHRKLIRAKMMEIMQSTVQKSTLKDLVKIFVKEEIGKQIQTECSKIYPLQDNCMVRKVKVLKKPKFDLTKLMELYKDKPEAQKAPAADAEAVNKISA